MAMAAGPVLLEHRLRGSTHISQSGPENVEASKPEDSSSKASDPASQRAIKDASSPSVERESYEMEHSSEAKDGRKAEDSDAAGEEEDELSIDHGKPQVKRAQQRKGSKAKSRRDSKSRRSHGGEPEIRDLANGKATNDDHATRPIVTNGWEDASVLSEEAEDTQTCV